MRIPNLLLPPLFFVEGLIAGAVVLNFVPHEGFSTWWAASAIGIAFAIAQSISMKQKLIGVHQSSEKMGPTSPDKHPGIDSAALDSITAQLGAAGFETQIDYTVERTPPNGIDGFARLLYNPTAHVFAEVNQVLVRGIPATQMALTLFSLYEDDWSFSTVTRNPTRTTAIIYALRRPKRLWQIVPGATAEVALARHVAVAQVLSVRKQLRPVQGDPIEAYLANQERQKAERFDSHRKRNLFAFLWDIDRYQFSPKLEWLGQS
jgi:hypothetical protein